MIRRLLLVIGRPLGLGVGGAGLTLDELAVSAAEAGVAPAILSLAPDTQAPALTSTTRGGYALYRARDLLAVLPAVVEEFAPDVILATVGLEPPVLASMLRLRRPMAVYLQDVYGLGIATSYSRDPLILYLANSQFTAARGKSAWGLEAAVVPPLIRPERYRVEGGSRHQALLVNPVDIKGLQIAVGLAKRRPEIRFRFQSGWAAAAAGWDRRPSPARLLANIEWAAPVADMRPVYAATRLVLMPSVVEEGWGRVVTEGQLSGIPALVSDRGALPETVGDGGVVVPLHASAEAWQQAFDRLWDDRAFYAERARAALARAEAADLQPKAIIGRLLDLLDRHVEACRAST